MLDKQIKNLLIDFGGVLIDLDRQRCIKCFKELGFADVEELLNIYHQQGLFLQLEQGLISSSYFRDEIRRKIGRPVDDCLIDAAWNSFLVGIPAYKLDLLLKLRRQYTVSLLSNTNAIHWEWSCRNAFEHRGRQVGDFFEKTYLSFEMKLVKPHRPIFEAVLTDASIDPQETFFIDDSEENCKAARELGIATYTPRAGEDWSHLFE